MMGDRVVWGFGVEGPPRRPRRWAPAAWWWFPVGLALALAFGGCAHPRGYWIATGATAAVQADAVAMADAAGDLYPGPGPEAGGEIRLRPDLTFAPCYPPPGWVLTGCKDFDRHGAVLWVLYPGPRPGLEGTALKHELGHVACAGSEADADRCGAAIEAEWKARVGR